jgi:6-phosphofructokinase 1
MSSNNKTIKKLAVMTSGGDSPGMNAFIRSTVRKALELGLEVYGVYEGYQGMIENKIKKLDYDSVCNIAKTGGTVLKTSRSKEFMTREGRLHAIQNLDAYGIDALICCGGNGSYLGLEALAQDWHGSVIGAPGTIDNDVSNTDYTIGFDTAVNTAMQAIDNLRDTGDSHNMHFIVEVMGRHCGDIATDVGIACGAIDVLIPETVSDVDNVIRSIRETGHNIIIVAEGDETGGAQELSRTLKIAFEKMHPGEEAQFRVCILGHVQRGGRPTARDRILAHKFAEFAVESIVKSVSLKAVAIHKDEYVLTDLS